MMFTALAQTILAGSEVSPDSLTTWVVGAVMSGLMGVLGFLLKSAFGRIDEKLDRVLAAQAQHDTSRAVLEQRIMSLEKQQERLEQQVRELSEGIAR